MCSKINQNNKGVSYIYQKLDAWLTIHLSQQTSEPAYYIVDCRIWYKKRVEKEGIDAHFIFTNAFIPGCSSVSLTAVYYQVASGPT